MVDPVEPTTTIRWVCAKHVIDKLRAHPKLAEARVVAGYPGSENFLPDTIWLGEVTGELIIPVGTGGRKHRDDKFRLPFLFRVTDRDDLDQTRTRLDELFAALEDVLADPGGPTLDDLPGVRSAEVVDEVQDSGLKEGLGWTGYGRAVIAIHARLT